MYTNTRTGPALHHIGQFDLENKEHLTVPPAVLMDALRLRMTNNAFQFGDTFWLQKVGTAMGAPPAPPWATIFFGIREEKVLARFGPRLQLYCCFIDDILGIWLVDPNPVEDSQQWTLFVALMQDYYGLEWIFEERSKKIKKGELYGHDDLDPRGSDRHVLIQEINESLFVYPSPFFPPPGSVNRNSFR